MKRHLLWFFTGCIIVAVIAFGVIKRQTYTDLSKQEDYLSKIYVAQFLDSIALTECENLKKILPEAGIILRVKVSGEIEHLYGVDRQKALVEQVYAGEKIKIGEEVYIFSDHWQLDYGGEPNSIERGFVNIMEVGSEYLVFAEKTVQTYDTNLMLVKLVDDFFIAPIFNYEERESVIMPQKGETTYVNYEDVMNNEFFAMSEETLLLLENLKTQMLLLYPPDN